MMTLTVSESSGGFAPISEGLHPAVCIGVYDIGLQYEEKFQKSSEKVIFTWEILDETIELDGKEERRTISKTFTKSFFERSNLRKMLKSWRGREFTAEELKAFDLRNVLGAACQLQITHSNNNDRIYANIDSVVSYPKNMPKPQPNTLPVAFDLDVDTWEADMELLPEWVQERIKQSTTYTDRMAERPFNAEDDAIPF